MPLLEGENYTNILSDVTIGLLTSPNVLLPDNSNRLPKCFHMASKRLVNDLLINDMPYC